jgi:hypothetical protein
MFRSVPAEVHLAFCWVSGCPVMGRAAPIVVARAAGRMVFNSIPLIAVLTAPVRVPFSGSPQAPCKD